MPGALAHVFFALDCLEEDAARLDFLQENLALVLAGSQGPDPFYFHSRVPWRTRQDTDRVHAHAGWLHTAVPADFLFPWFALTAAQGDPGHRKMMAAYLYGLVLHYLLDRRVHPYVYARSGFDERGELSGAWAAHHARFETRMDVSLALKRPDKQSRAASRNFFRLEERQVQVLADLHAGSFGDLVTRTECREAWADFATLQAFMNDPAGTRQLLFSVILGRDSQAAALARPRRLARHDTNDYCNDSHKPWPDPATGMQRTESLADLWDLAKNERLVLVKLLSCLLAQTAEGKVQDFPEIAALQALNHEGLLPGQVMRHHQSVFTVLPQ